MNISLPSEVLDTQNLHVHHEEYLSDKKVEEKVHV